MEKVSLRSIRIEIEETDYGKVYTVLASNEQDKNELFPFLKINQKCLHKAGLNIADIPRIIEIINEHMGVEQSDNIIDEIQLQ